MVVVYSWKGCAHFKAFLTRRKASHGAFLRGLAPLSFCKREESRIIQYSQGCARITIVAHRQNSTWFLAFQIG
jgi:hypothetical protein